MPADLIERARKIGEVLQGDVHVCSDWLTHPQPLLCAVHPSAGIMCLAHLSEHVNRSPAHLRGCDLCDASPSAEAYETPWPLDAPVVATMTNGGRFEIDGSLTIFAILALCARCRSERADVLATMGHPGPDDS